MLSFLFHFLLKHPTDAQAIREEVDKVCGSEAVRFEDLNKLEYIDAALKETLRLKSTAPAFTVSPIAESELLDGRFEVKKGTPILVILDALHRDPAVWGNDAEEFKPSRMLNGGFNNLPADAWKPFGNGMRGCIGRPFAWQESLLVVAMVCRVCVIELINQIFQHFDIRPANINYELVIKTALTIKPAHFYMHASPRKDRASVITSGQSPIALETKTDKPPAKPSGSQGPLAISYGKCPCSFARGRTVRTDG
jgi:cytochrome P450/NADPH-cytochrome P450 reductase